MWQPLSTLRRHHDCFRQQHVPTSNTPIVTPGSFGISLRISSRVCYRAVEAISTMSITSKVDQSHLPIMDLTRET